MSTSATVLRRRVIAGWTFARVSSLRIISTRAITKENEMGHDFCRALLRTTRQELTTEQRKRLVGAWSYKHTAFDGHYEFTVLDWECGDHCAAGFYWSGKACCAYAARVSGIEGFLTLFYPEAEAQIEMTPAEKKYHAAVLSMAERIVKLLQEDYANDKPLQRGECGEYVAELANAVQEKIIELI